MISIYKLPVWSHGDIRPLRVPPMLKKTNPRAHSVRLKSGPKTGPVSQQGAQEAGRCCNVSMLQAITKVKSKPEPMRFLKTRQTAQSKSPCELAFLLRLNSGFGDCSHHERPRMFIGRQESRNLTGKVRKSDR